MEVSAFNTRGDHFVQQRFSKESSNLAKPDGQAIIKRLLVEELERCWHDGGAPHMLHC